MFCECGCGQKTTISCRTISRRGVKKGLPLRFLAGHFRVPRKSTTYYKQIGRNGLLHRIRAERALGKPLPVGAVVHHADGSKDDDAPLVICQDQGYHQSLHARMRIRAAGGNPWTDKVCARCRQALPLTAFAKSSRQRDGHWQYCRPCDSEKRRNIRRELAFHHQHAQNASTLTDTQIRPIRVHPEVEQIRG